MWSRINPSKYQRSLLLILFLLSPSVLPIITVQAERIPEPRPDAPTWLEPPQNQTIEYGTRFRYKVNITQPDGAYWWFVSDTENFRIAGGFFSALIQDNQLLAVGKYFLGIKVWDVHYNSLESWIIITIIDSVPPTITTSGSINFTRGARDQVLSWTIYDLNPSNYIVTRNGVQFEGGEWTENEKIVEILLDYIPPGSHYFVLTATDIGGNSVSSVVKVKVFDNETADQQPHNPSAFAGGNVFGNFGRYAPPRIALPFMELFAATVLMGLAFLVAVAVISDKEKGFGFD